MKLTILIAAIISLLTIVYFFVVEYTTRQKTNTRYEEEFKKYLLIQDDLFHAKTLNDYYNVYLHIVTYFLPYIPYNKYLCANKYGIFRITGDPYKENINNKLPQITKSEIYLGNIEGLFTQPLSYWETCKDKEAVDIVKSQFYNILSNGLDKIRQDQIKAKHNNYKNL